MSKKKEKKEWAQHNYLNAFAIACGQFVGVITLSIQHVGGRRISQRLQVPTVGLHTDRVLAVRLELFKSMQSLRCGQLNGSRPRSSRRALHVQRHRTHQTFVLHVPANQGKVRCDFEQLDRVELGCRTKVGRLQRSNSNVGQSIGLRADQFGRLVCHQSTVRLQVLPKREKTTITVNRIFCSKPKRIKGEWEKIGLIVTHSCDASIKTESE